MKVCLLIAGLVVAQSVWAADPVDTKMDPKKQEMMKKYMDYATPGEGHKVLETLAGTWNYKSKMWETPKSKPQESTGQSTMKMIMGGRYLQQEFKGEAMGQPFEGMGFVGYNNLEKKYETTWLDNMATGTMHGTGTFDSKTKTLNESGQFTCPLSSDKKRAFHSEWKIKDKNTLVFTMSAPDLETGKDFKNMEITYKRAM